MHRRRTRTIARLAVIALVAAALATLAPQAAAPVAADGNEAPGAPLAFRSITAGDEHSCAILPSGAVKCWGLGTSGQLGQGSTATLGDGAGEMAALPAVNLGAGRTATAITAGTYHTCALLDDATVKCWGYNASGQLGQGSQAYLGDGAGEMAALAPVNLGAGRTATAVSAGSFHTCALLDDATVKCWGSNGAGQLGQGSTANLGDQSGEMAALPAVNLGAGRTATAVTAGTSHTCALLDDATVKCWGYNASGQLGQGSTADLGDGAGEMAALAPVNLGAGRTATAVTAGDEHTCALLDDATVKCWGFNVYGQLGQGSTATLGDQSGEMAALPAVNLGAGRTATAITAGKYHTCALLDDATVKCWGFNAPGQLGQDSTANLGDQSGEMAALPAVNLGAGRTATAITAGKYHTCALLDNATVKCWGNNGAGQLGQGSTAQLGDQAGEMAALQPIFFASPALTVQLSADESSVTVGDTVHLHVKVRNTGNVGLTNVAITDANAPGCEAAPFAVAVGADHSVNCTHVATAGEVAGGYHNSASVTSTEVTTPVVSNTVDVTVTPAPAPALTVQMSADESSVTVGDTVHLHVKVTNTGNVALTNVAITDANATGCQVAPFSLAVGLDQSVNCTHVATAGEVAGGYHNSASVVSTQVTTPVVSNSVDVTVLAVPAPALTVQMSADESSVTVGDTVHLHVKVRNTGNVALTNVAISDANAPGCEAAPFSVAVGADHSVNCTHVATAGEVAGGYHNTASAVSTQVTTPVVSNTVDVTVTPAPAPALSVQMSADESSVTVGATVHLHVKVTNTGNVALTNVAITDANATGCEAAPFSLAVGADTTIDCTHVATVDDQPKYQNSASVVATQITTPVVSNTVDVTVTNPSLSVSATADESSVIEGATIHLHVKVTNTGDVALTNVAISDGNAPGCEAPPYGLAVGDELTVDCEHVAVAGDVPTYTNTASVTSTEVTTPVESNEVQVAVTAAEPGLSVVASADEVSVAPGQAINQHLVVSNTGNVALHAVTISDPGAPDCADDGVFDLAVGGFTTIDCAYTATGNDTGTYTSEASVTADEVTTPVVSNPVEVTVDDAVTVVLSADQSSVVAGQAIGYHVTVRNTSALTLNGLAVVDDAAPECAGGLGFGFLSPGAQIVVDCTHVSAVADVGTFSNVATVDSGDIVAVESNQVEVTVVAPAPALSVSEAADPTEVVAGEPIDLALTVTNTGNVALHGITVADPSVPGCQVKKFDLSVGAHRGVFCSHVSTGADVPVYQNQATVTADELDAPVASNVVSVAVTIPAGESHVAGTVTEAGSGVPIGGAVAVLLSPTDFSPVAVGTADAAGHFSTLAAPGSYFVYVVDPTGGHAAGFHGSPSVVAATVDATTAADTALVSTRGAISGTVTGDTGGAPLANVLAMSVDLDRGRLGAGALTDDTGAYRISGLRPGPRLLQFVDLDGGHRPEFFDDASTPAASTLLSVVGASQATADAGLGSQDAPGGGAHLVGQLTSTTGEPLAGVAVLAVHASDLSLAAGVVTDSTGHYDLDLDAGDYRVAFYDPSGDHDFEWFDDQGTDGLADAATVTAGETPTTVDAALSPNTARVAGTVTDSGSGALLDGVLVAAIDATGTVVGLATTNPDGTYLLSGLPPGPVRLRFVDLSGTHVAEYHLDATDYLSATPVTVTAGAAASTIDAALTPTG